MAFYVLKEIRDPFWLMEELKLGFSKGLGIGAFTGRILSDLVTLARRTVQEFKLFHNV